MNRKMMMLSILLAVFSARLQAQDAIPPGTVLPAKLNSSISSAKTKPEQVVTARIMQNVPLAGGAKIRAGTQVVGHVVKVIPATHDTAAEIVLRFETLRRGKSVIPIKTSIRALASRLEVDDAETPTSSDEATPATSWTTVQVGGEVVYRGGGHVMDGGMIVGEPVYDGVLSRLRPNRDAGCPGSLNGNDQPQALWVFSSDACGSYGFSHLTVTHAGRHEPLGEIVLASNNNRNLKIWSGSGMLLRVTGSTR